MQRERGRERGRERELLVEVCSGVPMYMYLYVVTSNSAFIISNTKTVKCDLMLYELGRAFDNRDL